MGCLPEAGLKQQPFLRLCEHLFDHLFVVRNFLSLLLNHPFQNHGSCLDSELSHRVAYELGKSWQVYHLWAQCLPAPLVPATYLFSVGQPC